MDPILPPLLKIAHWNHPQGMLILSLTSTHRLALYLLFKDQTLQTLDLPFIEHLSSKFLKPQVPSFPTLFYPLLAQTSDGWKVTFQARGCGGGAGSSKGVAFPSPPKTFKNVSPSVQVSSAEDPVYTLAEQLAKAPDDPNLLSTAFRLVEAFSRKHVITQGNIIEILPLARVRNKSLIYHLLKAFISHICNSPLTEVHLFAPLKQLIQTASPDCLDHDNLVRVMKILFPKIGELHVQPETGPKRYQTLHAFSGILDAVADTGVVTLVDRNLFVIDRVDFQNPIFDTLKEMQKDPYQPLAAEATYAIQALARIPKNESGRFVIVRHLVQTGKALVSIAEACKEMAPSKLLEAYAPLKEALRFFPEVELWHDDLRILQLFIEKEDFEAFEEHFYSLSSGKAIFGLELGVVNLLTDLIQAHSPPSICEQALQFIHGRLIYCQGKENKPIRRGIVQRLLEFASYMDRQIREKAQKLLRETRSDEPSQKICALIPLSWNAHPVNPPEDSSPSSADLWKEVSAHQNLVAAYIDPLEFDQKSEVGTPPSCSHLPSPLKTFVGRKEPFEQLKKQLNSWSPQAPLFPLLLQGPGGIGKSELAIYFATQHRSRFAFAWFIEAENSMTLRQGYERIAKAFRIRYLKVSLDDLRNEIHYQLSNMLSDKPWLLLLDNVEESLPLPSCGGMVIATSQKRLWPGNSHVFPILPFTEAEALELFPSHLKADLPSCLKLIQELGNYPILLTQALRCIEDGRYSSILQYSQELEAVHPLWQHEEDDRYPRSLGKTFQLSLTRLEKENPLARAFLQLFPYFSPHQIDIPLLALWLKNEGIDRSPRDIIRSIEKLSLGSFEKERLSIHRLFQKVIEKTQGISSEEFFIKALLLLEKGTKSFDENNVSTWKICETFFLNVLVLTGHSLWNTTVEGGMLSSRLAIWLRAVKGDPQQALSYEITAYERLKQKYGDQSLAAASGLMIWGACLSDLGRHQEALEKHEEALKIQRAKLGNEHPNVAQSLNNAGACLSGLGRHQEALKQHEEALKILRAKLGGDHPDVASSLNNIGTCLHDLKRYQEALEKYEEALKVRRAKLGDDHPLVASSLNNIGTCLHDLKRYQEALEKHEEALKIRRAKLGDEHPNVAQCLNKMGTCLFALRRHQEALEKHEEALKIRRAKLGDEHPNVAQSLNNISTCLFALRRYQEALEKYEVVLKIRRAKLGDEHPNVAGSLFSMGVCLSALRHHQEALEQFEATLKIRRAKLGDDHPDVANSLNGMGVCLSALRRHQEALEQHKAALKIRRAKLGDNHPDVANSLHNMGACLYALGRHQEALGKYEAALKIRRAKLGDEHPDMAGSLNNMGICLSALGRPQEALEKHEEALKIRRAKLGDEHPNVADSLFSMGICLSALGRHQEALEQHKAALKVQRAKLGDEHPDVADSLNNMSACLSVLGRPQEALELRKKALA